MIDAVRVWYSILYAVLAVLGVGVLVIMACSRDKSKGDKNDRTP